MDASKCSELVENIFVAWEDLAVPNPTNLIHFASEEGNAAVSFFSGKSLRELKYCDVMFENVSIFWMDEAAIVYYFGGYLVNMLMTLCSGDRINYATIGTIDSLLTDNNWRKTLEASLTPRCKQVTYRAVEFFNLNAGDREFLSSIKEWK